ncbi:MAG: D-alanine--D-alanine ligase [Alphaproteobacteria bacterium]|nr:D-alanine--D-alanine ligase [Alphaproteobacteria bacterium]MCD8525620.1 D-alanine--D-alanine ligase [Alphaproteobacteria bacterium]MCD8569994.1 D-alanine--D-alanine ligase [Alphaproteobacteria bacterium]
MKKRIAVIYGGRSPEHDVSVVTSLQALQALDRTKFDPFPVYIATDGRWFIGDALKERANYLPSRAVEATLTEVTLDMHADAGRKKGVLLKKKKGLFGGSAVADEFDAAFFGFHGLVGEDGNMQGLMEVAGIPYTGMRTLASSVFMDKVATKHYLRSLGIPCLPFTVLKRPESGYLIPKKEIEALMKDIGYPAIIKPSHLGSSIGVAKVKDAEELIACLPAVFQYDDAAIVEPFVQNLVEYNVAVSKLFGDMRTSAAERPKTTAELLDFKQKYLSGGNGKTGTKDGGTKSSAAISEGMLSLTRELNPDLPKETEANIRKWAVTLFDAIDGTGAPRIDFIGNSKTGEIWMNEVNPCPGSFGYFLWEAAEKPVLFTNYLTLLVEEAFAENKKRAIPADPVPVDARLHKRHN